MTVVVVPRLQQVDQRFRYEHGFRTQRFRNFIATSLTTVNPIAESAIVRCSRRLSKLVSASFESFAPAYVKAASAVSIDNAWMVRTARPLDTERESHQFHAP